ncbi:MAG: type II toxin-antitoxin system mRNA interferase toxin, RelE/StbE family [Verrucomicrobiales bacterium]|nr:type II toxin-antitoxin system mRNA interferase toxin, RelE/StbE family [Verrucomicrobiales bacterium]
MTTGAATQVHSPVYDRRYLALPEKVRARVDAAVYAMGLRLGSFSDHRMKGTTDCRLRVGEYRVIYKVDIEENTIVLLTVRHRRDIYRKS